MSLTQIGPPFLTSSSLDHETMRPGDQEKLKAQSSELRDGPVPERLGGRQREKDRQASMTETHTHTERENERAHATLGIGHGTMERESATVEANRPPREEKEGRREGGGQGSFPWTALPRPETEV